MAVVEVVAAELVQTFDGADALAEVIAEAVATAIAATMAEAQAAVMVEGLTAMTYFSV